MTENIVQLRGIAMAVAELAGTLDGHVACDVGPSLSCREADALASVFLAAGLEASALSWIEGHAAWSQSEERCGETHEHGDDSCDMDAHCQVTDEASALAYVRTVLS